MQLYIAYLWWMLNQNNVNLGRPRVKIHGMTPTNRGTMLLAQKCMEMNEVMAEAPSLRANTICDGFLRGICSFNEMNKLKDSNSMKSKHSKDSLDALHAIPISIRDLCLRFYYEDRKDGSKPHRKFKVLYFASRTYANILEIPGNHYALGILFRLTHIWYIGSLL